MTKHVDPRLASGERSSRAAGEIADTMSCLRQVLATSDDPETRTKALLVAYVRLARIQAATFWSELKRDPGAKPHLSQADLGAHGRVAVDALIKVCLNCNHDRGMTGPEFDQLTAQILGESFFDRLAELIAAEPVRGNA